MIKKYFIVSSDLEATTIKTQCDDMGFDATVLVLKQPLYKHDLPVKELDKLEARAFKFQYEAELSSLAIESPDITALSSCDDEGMLWAAQLYNKLNPDHDSDISTYNNIKLISYSCLNVRRLDENSVWSPEKLRNKYRKWIHQSIVAQTFYWKVSRNLALKLFKSKRKALSLGMSRLLLVATAIDNPACYGISIPSWHADLHTTWTYDPYDAPPLRYSFAKNLEDTTTHAFTPDLPTSLEACITASYKIHGVSKTIIHEYYDPYIHCLLSYNHHKHYHDMIHMGILSATTTNALAPQLVNLQESMFDRFMELIRQEVCTQNDWETFNSYLINSRISSGVFNTSYVLQSLPNNLRYEYSLLYEYANMKMFQSYIHPDVDTYLQDSKLMIPSADWFPLNAFSGHIPVVESTAKSDKLTLLGPDAYLRIRESDYQTDPATHTATTYTQDFRTSFIDSPRYMVNVFHALSSIYDYRRSYIAGLIQQAVNKGFIALTGTGMRLTPYGHGVAHSLAKCLQVREDDALDLGSSLNFNDIQWETYLDDALESLRVMKEQVEAFEGIQHRTKVRKNNKIQKRVYKLVLDPKMKTAFFKCRKKKKPIWYKVLGIDHTELDLPRRYYDLVSVEQKLIPAPKYLKDSQWFKTCTCGNKSHSFLLTDTQILIQCDQCAEKSEFPYIVVHNQNNMFNNTYRTGGANG